MEQHNLNTTDFENEIGGKSLVSMSVDDFKWKTLSKPKAHSKLAERFHVSPQLFI